MKKLSLFIICFCAGLMASHITAMAAGATTLRVGVPNHPTNSAPISYESISTTQIDSTLSALTAQFPAQYQYPANFTQIEADKAFIALAGLKQDLDAKLFNLLLSNNTVQQIYFLTTDVNPLKLKLSQQGTSIGLFISEIGVSFKIKASTGGIGGFFCPNPDVTANIVNLNALGSYDIYTGVFTGANINYQNINVTNISCGGLPIINIFTSIIADAFFGGMAVGEIENAINSVQGIGNKLTVFSIRNFVKGLLDSNLLATINSDKALSAMDEIILKTDLNSGLQLDIEIDDGVNNTISFVASQRASSITNIEYTLHNVLVDFTIPARSVVEIYLKLYGNSYWSLAGTMTQTGLVLGELDRGTKIMAVARSTLVPGLYSFPSNIITTTHNFNGVGGSNTCPEGDCQQPL